MNKEAYIQAYLYKEAKFGKLFKGMPKIKRPRLPERFKKPPVDDSLSMGQYWRHVKKKAKRAKQFYSGELSKKMDDHLENIQESNLSRDGHYGLDMMSETDPAILGPTYGTQARFHRGPLRSYNRSVELQPSREGAALALPAGLAGREFLWYLKHRFFNNKQQGQGNER